jgi:hypothetical protein
MGYINFKDHAFIERHRENEKMNKMDVTVKSGLRLLLEVVRLFEVLEVTIV